MSMAAKCWALASVVLSVGLLAGCSQPKPVTDTEKIEHLLAYLESLKGATCIVGSEEIDMATLVTRLRAGWKAKADQVVTVKDFIGVVATFNEEAGKPYLIKMEDGTQSFLPSILSAELTRYERELWRRS